MDTGQPAAPIELTDCTGAPFSLAGLEGQQGLVVSFFRGAW